jgi:hypothetical protein
LPRSASTAGTAAGIGTADLAGTVGRARCHTLVIGASISRSASTAVDIAAAIIRLNAAICTLCRATAARSRAITIADVI